MQTDILTILHSLHEAGIWVHLSDDDALTIGPEAVVKKHAELLAMVRTHKPAVIHAIKSMMAHSLFGRETDDPRFEHATCLDCSQAVYVVLSPRRLAAHRLIDGQTVCPGSDRAQLVCAGALLEPFIADRCIPHPGAMLTWTSLRAALLAWCAERAFWLPPPQYLQQWLGARYTEHPSKGGNSVLGPVYAGLAIRQEEWLGDEEKDPRVATAVAQKAAAVLLPKKAKLVATGRREAPTAPLLFGDM